MKSMFPEYMPNADMASACFILGGLLFFIALAMSRDATKQNRHEHLVLWYGSDAVGFLAVLCWIAMVGFLEGWL